MSLKLLLDENLRAGAIWHAIESHQRGGVYPLDVVRVGDDDGPALGSADEDVIRWAATHGRLLISRDVKTLREWMLKMIAEGASCPGIILLRRGIGIPELVELLALVAHMSRADNWVNSVHWLP